MSNAKTQLLEFLAKRGLPKDRATFVSTQPSPGLPWTSKVVVTLPERPPLTGTGTARWKSPAEVAAAEDVLAKITAEEATETNNWALLDADAQAGDALIKLAGYLATELSSPEERSHWLQLHESDASLAQVFDRWFDAGDADLAAFGRGLGEKKKSTLVEALLWRRYGARVLGPGAIEALGELRGALARA